MLRDQFDLRAVASHDLIYFYKIDEWEFYDLRKDPQEMSSVHADPGYADIVRKLKGELDQIRRTYQDDGSVAEFPISTKTSARKKRRRGGKEGE